MSEEESKDDESKSVLEEIEKETRSPVQKTEKNPNRVRAEHKLAAIGQKAKEEKMRRKVEESMIKPKTWVSIGVIIGGICVGGLWLGIPLLRSREKEVVERVKEPEPKRKQTNKYFG